MIVKSLKPLFIWQSRQLFEWVEEPSPDPPWCFQKGGILQTPPSYLPWRNAFKHRASQRFREVSPLPTVFSPENHIFKSQYRNNKTKQELSHFKKL